MTIYYRSRILFSTLCLSLFSHISLAADCPASSNNIGAVDSCTVSGSASNIQLNFSSGFDSPQVVTPQGGNNGRTLGEQRRLAFIKGAEILAAQVGSSQLIVVNAQFNPLQCDNTSAVLGSAGAATNIAYDADDPSKPASTLANTFYPIALANAIANKDEVTDLGDISAEFNSNLGSSGCLEGGGWYYGFDDNSGNQTGFLTVLLHEVTHGLGFTSLANLNTGEKAIAVSSDGSTSRLDDIFSNFLYIKSEDKTWKELGTSSADNAKRKDSITSVDDLYWNGNAANTLAIGKITSGFSDNDSSGTFTNGDRIQIFAPDELKQGSSISHFDETVSPNEVMEPNLGLNACDIGLALGVLTDIGWSTTPPSSDAFYLNVNCSSVSNGDTLNSNFSGSSIKVSPVSSNSNYNYTLTYEGQNADSLISNDNSNGGIFINTPSSGEFAGVYVLTVSNGTDPNVSITINRPLRVIWSSAALLNDQDYTLTIEGGAANSVYDLTQSQVNVINFLNQQNQSITSATATNSPASFNPATLNITSNTVTSAQEVETTVKSQSNSYADASSQITVYPSVLHTFTILDSSGAALNGTSGELSDDLLISALSIEQDYTSNNTGQFSLRLPNTNDVFSVSLSKSGFISKTINITASNTNHTVTLTSNQDIAPTKPKFGSGGGGSIPLQLIIMVGLLLTMRRLSPLRH